MIISFLEMPQLQLTSQKSHTPKVFSSQMPTIILLLKRPTLILVPKYPSIMLFLEHLTHFSSQMLILLIEHRALSLWDDDYWWLF